MEKTGGCCSSEPRLQVGAVVQHGGQPVGDARAMSLHGTIATVTPAGPAFFCAPA